MRQLPIVVATAFACPLAGACGGGSRAETVPATTSLGEPGPPDAAPPGDSIVSAVWDVEIMVPAAKARVKSEADFFEVQYIDTYHTDGRVFHFIATYGRRGTALERAQELRAALLVENPECIEPVPETFLGMPGVRFSCVLGDAVGEWLVVATDLCMWSIMVTRRGITEEVDAYYPGAVAGFIHVLGGRPSPDVARCH